MIRSEISLQEPGHRYLNAVGREFLPVSRVISHFKEEFQSEMLSYQVAKKRVAAITPDYTDKMIKDEKEKVLFEWSEKNRLACEKGIEIHDAIQMWIETTFVVPKFQCLIDELSKCLKDHPRKQAEVRLHSDKAGIAGTADLLLFRTKTDKSVIDIEDFKTNVISRTNKYGKYLKYPLAHLEDCNYNTYALQLSLYAFLLEIQFGRKIGNLTIREIVDAEKGILVAHPVPYMKYEVRQMLSQAEKDQIIKFDVIQC